MYQIDEEQWWRIVENCMDGMRGWDAMIQGVVIMIQGL